MARQNRMNKKLVQFKFRHSSLCTFGYLRTRPVKCLSRDNLSWWSYAQINEYYLTHWAVPTVEHERNRIIGNKISSNISTHSYHLDFRFSCWDDSAESLALVDLETYQIGAYHHSCEKQNLRSPLIWLPRDKVIEVVSWGCQSIRSIYLDKCTFHCHLLQVGISLCFPIFIDHGDVCHHAQWQHYPPLLSFMPSLLFEDDGEPPLAQVNTKYNIVLCPPETVHHLKYLRCFILLVKSLLVAVSSKYPPSALTIGFGLYIHISKQQMMSVTQLLMARKYSDGYRSHWWSLVLMWQ